MQINDDFPSDPATSQYQLDRPVAPGDPSGQFGGIGTNLYDALSSISRYDDSKCVPRILCEVASGRRPGGEYENERASSSSYLGDLGRNALAQCVFSLITPRDNTRVQYRKITKTVKIIHYTHVSYERENTESKTSVNLTKYQ